MNAWTGPNILQNAVAATGNGNSQDVGNFATVGFQLSGTFSATVTFEATIDGTNWVAILARTAGTTTDATTATAVGLYTATCAGFRRVRARISAYTSGNVTVVAMATEAPTGRNQ